MSFVLTPSALTQKITQCVFNRPGTYSFKPPVGVSQINVVCVGGGGESGNSFYSFGTSPSSATFGGAGGGGGALAHASSVPVSPSDIITVRVANFNTQTEFNLSQTSFVRINTNTIAEASSGLRGTDLVLTSILFTSAPGGLGGELLAGNGSNGKNGGNATAPVSETVNSSPIISWRKFEGGFGGGAGGYNSNTDNGGGGNGASRSYSYLLGSFAGGFSFHSILARFSGGGVGIFGQGTTGANGTAQATWNGDNSLTHVADDYDTLNGQSGSSGIAQRYGGGRGGGARWRAFSGSSATWGTPQSANIGGVTQNRAGTGAVRIEFLGI